MSIESSIEWTDSTWNPVRGCSRVSRGCEHCYAEGVARRFNGPGLPYGGLVRIGSDGKPHEWNGNIRFVEEHLLDPLKWGQMRVTKTDMGGKQIETARPRRIFVNSMSDLFHENVTDEMRDRIFAVMALCPQHIFQVLTKRPERMLAYLTGNDVGGGILRQLLKFGDSGCKASIGGRWPLPNVWLGVSVEDQPTADARIPLLLQTPAAVRFISAEPLLGPVDLAALNAAALDRATRIGGGDPLDEGWSYTCLETGDLYFGGPGDISDGPTRDTRIDWIIVGGESGPNARSMHPDWPRSLRDQCAKSGVPFFFKQWGEWGPYRNDQNQYGSPALVQTEAGYKKRCAHVQVAPDGMYAYMQRVGKKAAGHLLDGVAHHAFPEVR